MAKETFTTNLNLVKPDIDDSYDIEKSNSNLDKIDTEIGNLKKSMENIDLVDSKVKVTDTNNKFTATTLDKVLDEIDDKIVDTSNKVDNIDLAANKVKYTDTTTQIEATNVQQALEWAVREIKALKQEVTGQTTRLSNINTELETEIGNPV